MSTLELKQKLINSIKEIDNPELLKEVFRLLEIENEEAEIYKLSEEEKKGIEEARAEIQAGKYISDENANKDIDKWLKE
jgi:hypothetical protein